MPDENLYDSQVNAEEMWDSQGHPTPGDDGLYVTGPEDDVYKADAPQQPEPQAPPAEPAPEPVPVAPEDPAPQDPQMREFELMGQKYPLTQEQIDELARFAGEELLRQNQSTKTQQAPQQRQQAPQNRPPQPTGVDPHGQPRETNDPQYARLNQELAKMREDSQRLTQRLSEMDQQSQIRELKREIQNATSRSKDYAEKIQGHAETERYVYNKMLEQLKVTPHVPMDQIVNSAIRSYDSLVERRMQEVTKSQIAAAEKTPKSGGRRSPVAGTPAPKRATGKDVQSGDIRQNVIEFLQERLAASEGQ